MSLRDWLLFIHITAVVIWVGGAFTLQFFSLRLRRSDDPGRKVALIEDANFLGTFVFNAAGIITAAAGIWLVIDSPAYGFGEDWVVLGIIAVAVSATLGMAFFAPQAGKVLKLAAEKGPGDPAVTSGIDRILLISRLELVLLVVVVYMMVFKPGT